MEKSKVAHHWTISALPETSEWPGHAEDRVVAADAIHTEGYGRSRSLMRRPVPANIES